MVHTLLLLAHVVIAVALIVLVLLQHGKGADVGAAFGSGASSTVFGARGASSFLSRLTGGLGAGFFVTCLALAYLATHVSQPTSVVEQVPVEQIRPALPPESQGPADVPPGPADVPQGPVDVPPVPAQ